EVQEIIFTGKKLLRRPVPARLHGQPGPIPAKLPFNDGRLLFPVALGRSSNKQAQQCIHKILRRVTDVRSPDGRFALFVGEGCIRPSRPIHQILETNHALSLESSNLNLRAVTEAIRIARTTPTIRNDCSLEGILRRRKYSLGQRRRFSPYRILHSSRDGDDALRRVAGGLWSLRSLGQASSRRINGKCDQR